MLVDVGLITVRNEVAKVMFLHLSVILFTGGVSASVHAGIPPAPLPQEESSPPGRKHPPRRKHPPPRETAAAADGTHPT